MKTLNLLLFICQATVKMYQTLDLIRVSLMKPQKGVIHILFLISQFPTLPMPTLHYIFQPNTWLECSELVFYLTAGTRFRLCDCYSSQESSAALSSSSSEALFISSDGPSDPNPVDDSQSDVEDPETTLPGDDVEVKGPSTRSPFWQTSPPDPVSGPSYSPASHPFTYSYTSTSIRAPHRTSSYEPDSNIVWVSDGGSRKTGLWRSGRATYKTKSRRSDWIG